MLSIHIALRYLFGKKSTNAINIITAISTIGIAVGTAAMILIMSVFNGFGDLMKSHLDHFNPDIKITALKGKKFELDTVSIEKIKSLDGVDNLSLSLEEVALFEYENGQAAGILKGVDANFQKVIPIDSSIRRGDFVLKQDNIDFGVIGLGLTNRLGINVTDAFTELNIYLPHRSKKSYIKKDFRKASLNPVGTFSIELQTDNSYILCDLSLIQYLLETDSKYTAVEIKTNKNVDEQTLISQLQSILGSEFEIKNRLKQDDAFLKVMNLEKWISFMISALILLIVAFNLVGALWMIVLEKRKDISVLKAMGMQSSNIRNLYLLEGLLICFFGLIIGLVIALVLYFLQKKYDLIAMSDGFLVEAYPIQFVFTDFLAVSAIVVLIGIVASIGPAVKASQTLATIRES